MTRTYKDLPKTGLSEYLMFLALLIPTFVVIAAAAVSLFLPDQPSRSAAVDTVAVCEQCRSESGDEGP
jgi:hypothetical protein